MRTRSKSTSVPLVRSAIKYQGWGLSCLSLETDITWQNTIILRSAYLNTSGGRSRLISLEKTHPTIPAELRTKYHVSYCGSNCSCARVDGFAGLLNIVCARAKISTGSASLNLE